MSENSSSPPKPSANDDNNDNDNKDSGSAHTFVETTFATPHWCNYCLKFIWSLGKKGFKCVDCGFHAHPRCVSKAPKNCSRIVRKSSRRRKLRQTDQLEDLDDIERALRKPGSGLSILDRKINFKTQVQTFIGSELIDWILTNMPVRSREEATTIAQRLLDLGHIENIHEKPTFKDEKNAYYRFKLEPLSDDEDENDIEKETESNDNDKNSNSDDDNDDNDDENTIGLNDFKLIKVIGKGGFGKVLKVEKKDTGKTYAMKVMDKSLFRNERHLKALMAERDIMLNDCPFLVHLYFSFQTVQNLYFVMDFVGGGDLAFYFDRYGTFPESTARFFGAQLVLALQFLHSCGVIYRDLKPENVLIDYQGYCVLTDFGLSKVFGESARTLTVCGTACYLAPEVVLLATKKDNKKGSTPYDTRVDIWSLGVLLYEMLSGRNPFDAPTFNAMAQRVLNAKVNFAPRVLAQSLRASRFIKKLMDRDPSKRLNFKQIKNDPWFLGHIDWKELSLKKSRSPFRVSKTDNFDEFKIEIDDIIGDTQTGTDVEFEDLDYVVPKLLEDPTSLQVNSSASSRRELSRDSKSTPEETKPKSKRTPPKTLSSANAVKIKSNRGRLNEIESMNDAATPKLRKRISNNTQESKTKESSTKIKSDSDMQAQFSFLRELAKIPPPTYKQTKKKVSQKAKDDQDIVKTSIKDGDAQTQLAFLKDLESSDLKPRLNRSKTIVAFRNTEGLLPSKDDDLSAQMSFLKELDKMEPPSRSKSISPIRLNKKITLKSEKSTKKVEKTDEKESNNDSNEKNSMTLKSIKSKTLNKRTKLDSIGDQSIEVCASPSEDTSIIQPYGYQRIRRASSSTMHETNQPTIDSDIIDVFKRRDSDAVNQLSMLRAMEEANDDGVVSKPVQILRKKSRKPRAIDDNMINNISSGVSSITDLTSNGVQTRRKSVDDSMNSDHHSASLSESPSKSLYVQAVEQARRASAEDGRLARRKQRRGSKSPPRVTSSTSSSSTTTQTSSNSSQSTSKSPLSSQSSRLSLTPQPLSVSPTRTPPASPGLSDTIRARVKTSSREGSLRSSPVRSISSTNLQYSPDSKGVVVKVKYRKEKSQSAL